MIWIGLYIIHTTSPQGTLPQILRERECKLVQSMQPSSINREVQELYLLSPYRISSNLATSIPIHPAMYRIKLSNHQAKPRKPTRVFLRLTPLSQAYLLHFLARTLWSVLQIANLEILCQFYKDSQFPEQQVLTNLSTAGNKYTNSDTVDCGGYQAEVFITNKWNHIRVSTFFLSMSHIIQMCYLSEFLRYGPDFLHVCSYCYKK